MCRVSDGKKQHTNYKNEAELVNDGLMYDVIVHTPYSIMP